MRERLFFVVLLQRSEMLFIWSPEADLRIRHKSHMLYLIVWWWPGLYLLKLSGRPSPNNDMQTFGFVGHERVCGAH